MGSRARGLALAGVAAAALCGCGASAGAAGAGRPVSVAASLTAAAPATTASVAAAGVPRPRIVSRPIPFGAKREREMAAYARRHYGIDSYRLRHPHVIVWHFTGSTTFSSAYNTFAPDVPDIELHELPGLCAHFVVDRDGTIYQLVRLSIMCRHTVGLNWTAIGIEQVATSDAQILADRPQVRAVLRLTRWLRCRFGIRVRNVIGHNESLSSPYHHERVAALRKQTHADWTRADMRGIRSRLRALGGCAP